MSLTKEEYEAAVRQQWDAINEISAVIKDRLPARYAAWTNDVPREYLSLLPQGSQKLIWVRLESGEIVRVVCERLGERDVWAELRGSEHDSHRARVLGED